MHAYSCELVHSVTLIAQPRSKTPFAKVGAMKAGKYEPRNRGTFGILWFTDFGDKFWEACQGVDDTPKLRLRKSGFDEMDWSDGLAYWQPYKPDPTEFKRKGNGKRHMTRCMDLKTGLYTVGEKNVWRM